MSATETPAHEFRPESSFGASIPLVPDDSTASRALVVVIAIMTLLACLTAGAAALIARASHSWRTDVSQNITIQIKPRPGQDTDALVAKTVAAAQSVPGIEDVRPLSLPETARMLEPWLGQGIDISKLPIPRLILARLPTSHAADLAPLRAALGAASPDASVDDHSVWLTRLDTMANMIVTFAGTVFVLVIIAMATAVGFATRGAVAANREIIEVLHFVGASDLYVAQQFQGHFMRLGFRGAAIGGGAATAFFLAAYLMSTSWRASSGGVEVAALFGAFALNIYGYIGIIAVSLGVTALTGYLSRSIVFIHLSKLG